METYLIKLEQIFGTTVVYVTGTSFFILLMNIFLLVILYYVFRISLILSWMFLNRLRRKGIAREKTLYPQFGYGGKKVLIAGDSTAAGTGASSPTGTFTNMLAQDFPEAAIFNTAWNGALTRDILEQFKYHKHLKYQYDAIIISTGGNDIWGMVSMGRLQRDLVRVLGLAKAMSNRHVLVLFFGSVGSAPLFPYLIRKLLMSRERKILKVFQDICEREHVRLIELFIDKNENPFVEDPKRYFSPDGLHPSEDGYALWYEHLLRTIRENKYLS